MTGHYAQSRHSTASLTNYFVASRLFAESLTDAALAAMSGMMTMHHDIVGKLTAAFAPLSLQVEDESQHHAGHAGHRPGGETHFRIHIVANAFEGKSRLERHRLINEALAAELRGGVHALAIHASAPGE
jgi:BolA protein